jgi:hypothetical protein
MIKDFRALLDNTEDAMHRAAIYRGSQEFIKHMSRNKTYISDEPLHPMELCIYHGINVQVEGLEDEQISEMCRCTGSQSLRGGDRLHVGKATPGEVLWRAEWVSPMPTAMTIQVQAPQRG